MSSGLERIVDGVDREGGMLGGNETVILFGFPEDSHYLIVYWEC